MHLQTSQPSEHIQLPVLVAILVELAHLMAARQNRVLAPKAGLQTTTYQAAAALGMGGSEQTYYWYRYSVAQAVVGMSDTVDAAVAQVVALS
jgi:hypothetical protein